MPLIFKAPTSIATWLLLIGSWIMLLATAVAIGVRGDLFSSNALGINDAIAFALAMTSTVLAAVYYADQGKSGVEPYCHNDR